MKNFIFIPMCVALTVVAGCATAPTIRPVPPSDGVRSQLGRIAIVVPESEVRFTCQQPATKASGAIIGTGVGAGVGAGIGVVVTPFGGPVAGMFIGLGAVCGGILGCGEGIKTGLSDKDAQHAMSVVTNVCTTRHFEGFLREQLQAAATNDTGHSFTLVLPHEFPRHPEINDYRSLANQGVNTVWETTVEGFQLRGRLASTLSVRVRTKLIQLPQGTELYSYEEVFHGRTACGLPYWADNNTAVLLKETQQGAQVLSEMLVEQLFLRATEPATNPAPGKVKNEN
jgi:hypothetical protein